MRNTSDEQISVPGDLHALNKSLGKKTEATARSMSDNGREDYYAHRFLPRLQQDRRVPPSPCGSHQMRRLKFPVTFAHSTKASSETTMSYKGWEDYYYNSVPSERNRGPHQCTAIGRRERTTISAAFSCPSLCDFCAPY
eukprot:TRINITY_DN821_c0_g1_i1.p1 TRINITY_DN821_c0_g1~~TRINITY_DN821_c0_g1_i1.p1  ORF type:complete len:139 (-),score=4.52 TRINITY_DN821_c0_g1_i1:542-958(-)